MKKLLTLFILAFSLSTNAQTDSTKVDNFQKTDEVLSEVVKKALIVAEKTGDFVIEQTPLLLQEFYKWHIFSDIFWILFGIMLFIISRYLPNLWLEKESPGNNYDSFFGKYTYDSFLTWMFFGVGTITSLVITVIEIYDLVYILVAPKLYLIEYFIK